MSGRDELTTGATVVSRTDKPALRAGGCKLVQLSGEQKGRHLDITAPTTVIGSSNDCDLSVHDGTVSRRHFEIGWDSTSYVVRDLGSTNGTMLNGTQIREAILEPGAVLRAGDIEFRLEPLVEPTEILPSEKDHFGAIRGRSYEMRRLFAVLERVANTEMTILIEGETGTGKSVLARAVHQESARRGAPFIVVDCGAIAPTLVESELFGHERGAFTGAIKDRQGAFELAAGGTLFIDELTELAPNLQPKLLRALEDREITRVGSHAPVPVDCRVVAATQKDLEAEVEAGRFRADLYFRLAVVTVGLPPLRERRDDLPMLIDHFLKATPGSRIHSFEELSPELQTKLLAEEWRGNIRELRNTVQRLIFMYADEPRGGEADAVVEKESAASGATTRFDTDLGLPFKVAKERLLSGFERAYVAQLLERHDGNVTQAAKEAGLDRKHIYNLISKYGLGGE